MKKYKEKELNAFIEKTIKPLELEKAPKDFVESVMNKVAIKQSNITEVRYTPLVPKTIWFGSVLLVAALFWLLGLEKVNFPTNWLSVLRLNTVGNIDVMDVFPKGFTVSDSTLYALAGLLVFMGVQVWYLKRFFAKRRVLL